jgi:hypothetical protein
MMPPQTDEQREAYSKLAPIRDRAMITDYFRQFDPGRHSQPDAGLAPGSTPQTDEQRAHDIRTNGLSYDDRTT